MKPNVTLGLIIFVAIGLRILVALYLGDTTPPAKDESSYSILASRLANGHGYSFPEAWYPFAPADTPTAFWSFLYTAFAAGIYAVVGFHPLIVRLVSAIIGGVLLPLMTFRLSMILMPKRVNLALIAAACASLYAYFVLYSAMIMTETLFIVAILWSLERSIRLERVLRSGSSLQLGTTIWLGISLGFAALLRQSILPWVVVLFAWFLRVGFTSGTRRTAIWAVLTSGSILTLFILPFTIRNYLVYGDFLLLNSNSGYAMYSAQHPMHGTNFQAFAAAPLPTDINPVPENEAQWDRVLLRQGISFVIQDPARYLLLSMSRAADYFLFWPLKETSMVNNIGRVLSFGLFLPLYIHGLWISRSEWRRFSLLYLFLGFYTVMHLLTWSMVRYRLPVDAVLIIFAAISLARIRDKAQSSARWRQTARPS